MAPAQTPKRKKNKKKKKAPVKPPTAIFKFAKSITDDDFLPTALDNLTSPDVESYRAAQCAVFEKLFYYKAREEVKRMGHTRVTFLGYQYQNVYGRPSLLLNFNYERGRSVNELQDMIVCVVCNVERAEGLVWGVLVFIREENRLCGIEFLDEITELNIDQVLVRLSIGEAVIVSSGEKYVDFKILHHLYNIESDLPRAMQPAIITSLDTTTRPCYLTGDTLIDAGVLLTKYRQVFCSITDIQGTVQGQCVLEDRQLAALTACLESNVVVVQAPPGCGKTFLAVKVTQVLSSLKLESEKMPPILLMTVKNTVLDDILKKFLLYFDKEQILRLGQKYDHANSDMVSISVNNHREYVGKSGKRKNSNREQIEAKVKESKRAFKALDNARHITYSEIWCELRVEQRHAFIEHTLQYMSHKIAGDDVATLQDILDNLEWYNVEEDEGGEAILQLLRHWAPRAGLGEYCRVREEEPEEPDGVGVTEESNQYTREYLRNLQTFHDDTESDGFCISEFSQQWVPCKDLVNTMNPWNLSSEDRFRFILSLMHYKLGRVLASYQKLHEELKQLSEIRKSLIAADKSELYKQFAVIGATVHGAVLHHAALWKANVTVVVVDEASQVSEQELIAALPPSAQHLIMIGDYKQLPPHCDTEGMRDRVTSLMHRMIMRNTPYTSLTKQYRMRPEIAELLKDIYPDLTTDQRSVRKGLGLMKESVFWWENVSAESRNVTIQNDGEACKVRALVMFLVQREYVDEGCITVLTGYKGQVDKIKEKVRKCNVRTIDSYQGSENDVIILSLVRSNRRGRVGFMEDSGRRCVAQSRARRALYFVGDSKVFSQNSEWSPLLSVMNSKQLVGHRLPVKCEVWCDRCSVSVSTALELERFTTQQIKCGARV